MAFHVTTHRRITHKAKRAWDGVLHGVTERYVDFPRIVRGHVPNETNDVYEILKGRCTTVLGYAWGLTLLFNRPSSTYKENDEDHTPAKLKHQGRLRLTTTGN